MKSTRTKRRYRRKMSIKKSVRGTSEKPRVFVFRSNTRFYVGVANDVTHTVMVTMMSDGKGAEKVAKLGKEFGKKLKTLKIEQIVFDRSGYKYHGNIKVLADSIREAGINF